ncbi:hypothetical protein M1446_03085 [Candidatus Dependentiae bacterium]|nr:hypothetical protein [Candidatus Dependentiae bacterium]
MKSLFFLTFLTCFLHNNLISQQSTQIVTFFIKRYNGQIDLEKKIKDKLEKPGAITNAAIKRSLFPTYSRGILASYLGQICFSDRFGQIMFNYLTKKDVFTVVVTQSIKPVFMQGRTIHHWVLSESKDSKWYSFEKIQDPVNKQFYWNVTEKEIPANRALPLDAIIIFAQPEDIIVYTGKFPVPFENNIVLPDIYATKKINIPLSAIQFLKIRKYFAPVKKEYKFDQDKYQLMIS